MNPKLPHGLFTMLWLSLLLLLLLEFYKSRSHLGNIHHVVGLGIGTRTGSSSSSTSHRRSSVSRKVLASKFDFTPFRKPRGKSPRGHSPHLPDPPDDGRKVDPRYGVEKRLVPTGPNPLHH
ncbi:CLAVATA3/ESR (CLE)-related protein 12 [Syzygium oleosum]|uniref:CLAVATA3/ESR (CLE)-related protein 12 n=1 Tax=Syzygium oleosum TaxID=219896 RepID=UPI0024BB8B03|nr:CLAVATA3/ESR (CLE)-related protein 12 [Syzygium oleosum]